MSKEKSTPGLDELFMQLREENPKSQREGTTKAFRRRRPGECRLGDRSA